LPASAAVVGSLPSGAPLNAPNSLLPRLLTSKKSWWSQIQVHRLQDIDVHGVLDLAAGVARRQRQVGDQRVAAIVGIDLAVGSPGQLFIGAHGAARAEGATLKRRGLDRRDLQQRDPRLDGTVQERQQQTRGAATSDALPHVSS
jgi:hypothetical protein